MRPIDRAAPYLILVASAAFFGGTWVSGRGVEEDVPPITLAFLRWSIASLFILPFCLRGAGRHVDTLKAEAPRLAVLALLGMAFFGITIFSGLRHTTAVNGALINAATPVYVIALSFLGIGDRSGWRAIVGAVIAFAGLVIIITGGEPVRLLALDLNRGDVWILTGMFCWALYTVLLRLWPTKLPPTVFFAATALLGALFLAPVAAVELALGAPVVLSAWAIGGALYLGIFASVAAYMCWNFGVLRIGAAPASLFQYLIPAFATVFALIILDERVALFHLVGAALIVAGITLANMTPRRPAA